MGKVSANKMNVITDKSSHNVDGMAVSVCKTPSPTGPVPIPYPCVSADHMCNVLTTKGLTKAGAKSVLEGKVPTESADKKIVGDTAGVASNRTMGKVNFVAYSFDVKFEGAKVTRALDPVLRNRP